ncbi:MAG: glycosyltransferase family 2 protein [Lachnospiraceae bacterium]|nr:glycosyltransferase family 2 protein [Lachnospiraceae bacterium]
MSERLVSVIITTYNRDFEVVEKSIYSVINQTYKPIELIIVDDNNADTLYREKILEGLKKYPQVIYVKHDINKGAQISRNDGLKAAHGDYFAFLDDDDVWFENKIECQMQYFDDDEVGLVYCKGYLVKIKDDGEEISRPYNMSKYFIDEISFEDMLYGDYIGTTTQAIISRKAVEKCGMFDVAMSARQDYEMWIRISTQFKCKGVPEYLFIHYIHRGEQISKNYKNAIHGYNHIYKKYNKDFDYTSKFHILLLISKCMKKEKMYGRALINAIRAGAYFVMAFLFENKKLRKRIAIHHYRK